MEYLRRHKCRHNPGGSNKSSILPLEDYKGNIIGEVMTREQKIDFERRHSQVCSTFTYFRNLFTFNPNKNLRQP